MSGCTEGSMTARSGSFGVRTTWNGKTRKAESRSFSNGCGNGTPTSLPSAPCKSPAFPELTRLERETSQGLQEDQRILRQLPVCRDWRPVKKERTLVVTPPRIERGTYSLEGCCSIHLSYGAETHQCERFTQCTEGPAGRQEGLPPELRAGPRNSPFV